MVVEHSFAGFIMTYERSDQLGKTIHEIFSQTVSPGKLLIIDNSATNKTQVFIEELNDHRIEYFRMGYNAGPAGAAKIGLQKLVAEGYEWIYWGDDDDPPGFTDSFEKLLSIGIEAKTRNIGIVGAVGHFFSKRTGEIIRMPDAKLFQARSNQINFINVDSIAGGQTMIVNACVVRAGVLPDEKLFFGFEELDFCIKVKRASFDLVVSTDLFLRSREKTGKLNYKQPLYIKRKLSDLHRQYYSVRNILLILKSNQLNFAYRYQVIKNITKMLYGFRYGMNYGRTNSKMIAKGIWHGITGVSGKKN